MTFRDGAADLIVSTNDAKYRRVAGVDTFPLDAGPDTLDVIDASDFPPRVVATIEVAASIAGPPQAVAITLDGRLAIVSAPNRYDHAEKNNILGTFLQIVDLEARPPRLTGTVDLAHHPQGLAINRAGTLLVAATVGGTVAAFRIEGKALVAAGTIAVAEKRLAGIAITPDGTAALVALRDEQGIVVLDIDGTKVGAPRERVSTGVAPYAIDVSSDGRWAVVGNVGLAGLAADPAMLGADADSVTLIDISKRPFRAVQHLTVPALPEGVAISPDGRWIAVQAMDGSNLVASHPGRHGRGRLLLWEIRGAEAVRVGDLPAGEAGQGVVFSADNRYVLAQFNVEQQIAVYAVNDGSFEDTGQRIATRGGPSSIRSMPR